MKTLSLKLSHSLATKLSALAKEQKKTPSLLVKEAIEAYVARVNGKGEVSCGELAGDLLGSLEGPGDLSFNKKHMDGFGL